jgi:hypothetical protein
MVKNSNKPPSSRTVLPIAGGAQFNATPRFSFAHSQSSGVSKALYPSSTPSLSRYVTSCAQGPDSHDVVEDKSDTVISPNVDARKWNEKPDPAGSIEKAYGEEEYEYEFIKLRTPKRRRLSSSPILNSRSDLTLEDCGDQEGDYEDGYVPKDMAISSSPIISSPPPTPFFRPAGSTTAPRFILPLTATSESPTPIGTHTTTFVKPPRFRAAEEREPRPPEPLPEMFSPHRRGQKFLAGGLAAEVISWLVRLENSVPSHVPDGPGNRQWPVRLVVDETRGGNNAGMTLVRGRRIDAGMETQEIIGEMAAMKVILAGQEMEIGLEQKSMLKVGDIVEVKGPTWEVTIEGERWGVGVDWKMC